MINIQIDMLSPYYYSTLGYDEELIDYLYFIEDHYINDLFPKPIFGKSGRKRHEPSTLFRMHFLYFTRPEFRSFRQMCKELKKPKHQDYRNFLGIKGLDVPSHTALSRFRAHLGLEDNRMNELCEPLIGQAQKMEGFLNLMLGSIDSRPVYAAVGGFKKECTCKDPDQCSCPPRFSDTDATAGRQRTKVNQNKFFIGYRKSTIICPSSQGPMPLCSKVVHAKTSDNTMLLPCLKQLSSLGIFIPFMAGDMGYIGANDKVEAIKTYGTAVCTDFKKNMTPPEECDEKGRVLCTEGHLAHFVEFDKESLSVTYCGDPSKCHSCFRYDTCDREFTYSFEEDPQFFGPICQGSKLQDEVLKFRKQSELNFALESNMLDNVFHHKKLTIRGQKRVEVYLRLADLFRLMLGMIHHAREKYIPKERADLLRSMVEKSINHRAIPAQQAA